jgi:hypothetical protein
MTEACMCCVLVYGAASYLCQPYVNPRQNYINLMASLAAFVTIYLALLVISFSEMTFTGHTYISGFFLINLVLVNAGFILWICSLLARAYEPKVRLAIINLLSALVLFPKYRFLVPTPLKCKLLWKIGL